MRIGRIQNVNQNSEVSIFDAYPRISEMFLEENATPIQRLIDATGEYYGYISRAGINVVMTNDSEGNAVLMTVSDYDLSRMLGTNPDAKEWE